MFRLLLAIVLALGAGGRPAAADEISEGISWLHSFEYERALAAFERAEKGNPRALMAYWGQAMCYEQLLWGNENVEEARRILARARASGAADGAAPAERAWFATLDSLFGDGGRPARLAAYAAAMAKLAAAYPDDPDVASFHGLAVIATRSRGLAGAHPTGAQGDHGASGGAERQAASELAGSPEQAEAARIFERVLSKHPRHPGALHYLIHTWDDPANAHRALEAARVYPSVAPESSHARHMPAHVFVQLGMWPDAILADEGAASAARAKVVEDGLPVTAQDFHPLSWLVYEYLQAGRVDDARRTLEQLRGPAEATQDPRLLSLLATLRARVAVETRAWSDLAGPRFVNYDELFGVAFSAAHRGDMPVAERGRTRLSEMASQPRYAERRPLLEVMALQVGAVLRAKSGDLDGALSLLAEATAMERALPASIGPPALIKPAQEQYAELLLEAGRPEQAAAQFEGALDRARNRRASVMGLEAARAELSPTRGRTTAIVAAGVASIMVLLLLFIARRRRLHGLPHTGRWGGTTGPASGGDSLSGAKSRGLSRAKSQSPSRAKSRGVSRAKSRGAKSA